MKKSLFAFLVLGLFQMSAQTKHLPIIDVHVHAMKVFGKMQDLSPWFLSNMPGTDPNEKSANFLNSEGAISLPAAKTDQEFQEELMKTMKRLNMTIVVSGDASVIRNWKKAAAPDRVIPSIGFNSADGITVQAFEDSLKTGFYKVVGEIGLQYQGLSPSDPKVDKYFEVAERLNIPVAIHMGTGGNGMANLTSPKYRASLGNPLLLEDLLARHPKLKVWVMHAGYPMIDEMVALMGANSHVYVDLAGLIWSYPLEEIHMYLRRLVQAGFGKRIMYGTDLMIWPKLMETSIGVIENAQYLSFEQKRDILFNNAVRFFRLDPAKYQ